MSAGRDKEWVYVDLGTRCTFDRVVLSWIAKPAQASLELSNDAKTWTVLRGVDSDELKLDKPATARYVRILMTGGPERYVLSEIEVWGRGGLAPQAKSQSAAGADGRLNLAAGAWRIERASLVNGDGVALSQAGFNDQDWIPATVPGTVLTSYFNVGAVPDPNFGDNIFAISDSFFYSDFWYRDEFVAPQVRSGRRLWLNFSGVNWKADVFLNGQKIGRIEGGFERGRFDVTQVIRPGEKNALAVRVEKNATPGTVREKTWDSPDKNGGALGADNPTYHASIGWDWIPTIRGRNTGIWGPVFLDQSGAATIDNPFVSSSLRPDGADVVIATTITNHGNQALMGVLKGRFGESKFQQAVSIDANSAKEVVLAPLHLQNPKLWWPAGYGDPNLYPVELEFVAADGAVSDVKRFESGVRQFRYAIENGALKMWINGRRFIPHGGNWGFSEAMLRYRGREYDAAMRYHADMHLNMVRNWVGQIGDDAFYDAADRHGIVVWQDFWLANPWDGPDPDDETMFMRNARDTILRIRNHPSIGLYCGRNEGYPPERLEQDFRKTLAELHPGIQYIPSSADEVVSGHGPYQAMPIDFYFRERATAKMHSELGMPNIMTMDSVRQTMPEDAIWPQGRMWGLHDFSLHGAQGGESFIQRIDRSYGGANSAADWIELAQFVNYNGYRAMYEAQSKNRMGLLIWMSHPTWPSFVWQTYDYFLEPTAGYFGTKKGSEPLHIQWNPLTDEVEVVNYSAGKVDGLTATAEIFNMDGGMKWNKSASVDSTEDSLQTPMKLEFPAGLSPVHFIRLRLTRDHDVVSDNFYWRATEQDNFSALRAMPKAKVRIGAASTEALGSVQRLTAELVNNSNVPALMVRVKVVREKSRDRILPAIYSDNYVALMPGEHRTVQVDITTRDTRGEAPELTLDGFNLEP
ncbi:MAG: discoidin domain-containing protein [Acidobacteriaceae bacterium]|nr:discoidin domain-containing protein [Acidobacteriaceae bacterium]